jgi:chemotaxis regulatin CheY-phosphate phosphatase CheZ
MFCKSDSKHRMVDGSQSNATAFHREALHEDGYAAASRGRKLFAGTIEAADPRELVLKWSAFLATAERGTYFATYRGSFVGPELALENSDTLAA